MKKGTSRTSSAALALGTSTTRVRGMVVALVSSLYVFRLAEGFGCSSCYTTTTSSSSSSRGGRMMTTPTTTARGSTRSGTAISGVATSPSKNRRNTSIRSCTGSFESILRNINAKSNMNSSTHIHGNSLALPAATFVGASATSRRCSSRRTDGGPTLGFSSGTRKQQQQRRQRISRLSPLSAGLQAAADGTAAAADATPTAAVTTAAAAAAASPGPSPAPPSTIGRRVPRAPPSRRAPVGARTSGASTVGKIKENAREGRSPTTARFGVELVKLQDDLKHFASVRMWREALAAFEKAKADGVPLTASTYTQAITSMSKGGRWKEATRLLEEMITAAATTTPTTPNSPKISPSITSYNSAITACSRGRRSIAALNLLRGMWARSRISPDRFSYAAVIMGFAKSGKAEEAVALLEEMRGGSFGNRGGVEPDVVCLTSAMQACQKGGAWKEAAVVMTQVRNLEPEPAPMTMTRILSSAISSCIADGAWEQAIDYLTDTRMVNSGKPPPASSYAAAAYACARAGQATRAEALISELVASSKAEGGRGGQPTTECYNAVVYGYVTVGDLDAALKTLKKVIPEMGLKANTESFNHLMIGYAKNGKLEAALKLLDELQSGQYPEAPANRQTYNAVIEACGRSGEVETALKMLAAMRALSHDSKFLKPTVDSYWGALCACKTAVPADYATALELLATMKAEGVRFDQRCTFGAVTACVAAGRPEETAQILEGIASAGISTSERARGLAKEACLEAAAEKGGFERAIAAFDLLGAIWEERVAAKEELTKAEAKTEEEALPPTEAVAADEGGD